MVQRRQLGHGCHCRAGEGVDPGVRAHAARAGKGQDGARHIKKALGYFAADLK